MAYFTRNVIIFEIKSLQKNLVTIKKNIINLWQFFVLVYNIFEIQENYSDFFFRQLTEREWVNFRQFWKYVIPNSAFLSLKFMVCKKAKKHYEISTLDLTFTYYITSNLRCWFCQFLWYVFWENMNFNYAVYVLHCSQTP